MKVTDVISFDEGWLESKVGGGGGNIADAVLFRPTNEGISTELV